MRKVHIGNVLVTPADCTNPYTYKGPLRHQHPAWGDEPAGRRVESLRAFMEGGDTTGMVLWEAPANGGARQITADDVDWRSSGMEGKRQ